MIDVLILDRCAHFDFLLFLVDSYFSLLEFSLLLRDRITDDGNRALRC